jgi:hypothetical protein
MAAEARGSHQRPRRLATISPRGQSVESLARVNQPWAHSSVLGFWAAGHPGESGHALRSRLSVVSGGAFEDLLQSVVHAFAVPGRIDDRFWRQGCGEIVHLSM